MHTYVAYNLLTNTWKTHLRIIWCKCHSTCHHHHCFCQPYCQNSHTIIEHLCIVLSIYIKFWLTPFYYQRVVWFELCELFRVLKSNFIEFARKTSIKLIVRPYLFLTIIKMPTFWFQRFNLIIFLYWQDEISSELALVKGKVDSILSDSEVTVQVRKFPHHYVV